MASTFITPNTVPPLNKPQFILSGFGLPLLKPKFYKVGESNVLNDKLRPSVSAGALGLPVFGGIGFLGGSYVDRYGNTITYEGLFLDCCLIEVGVQREIVETKVQGRDSSIKQFISNGDDAVTIRGVLAGGDQLTYPDVEMRALMAVVKAEQSVSIQCPYLQDYFGISQLVVRFADFPQKEGNPTVQLFELKCLSDAPVTLKIKDA